MKNAGIVAVLVVVLLAVICANSVLAQGEPQNITVTLTEKTKVVSTTASNSVDGDNDVVIQRSSRVPAIEAEVASLKSALVHAGAQRNMAAVGRLQSRIRSLQSQIDWLKRNPLGGTAGQHRMWAEIHKAGIKGEGELKREFDERYISREEYGIDHPKAATPPAAIPAPPPSAPTTPTTTTPPSSIAPPAPPAPVASTAPPTTTSPAPATAPAVAAPTTAAPTAAGGTALTPMGLVGWTMACVPLILIIAIAAYYIVGNYRRFTDGVRDLVAVGTGSAKKYTVRGNYGPFQVEYKD